MGAASVRKPSTSPIRRHRAVFRRAGGIERCSGRAGAFERCSGWSGRSQRTPCRSACAQRTPARPGGSERSTRRTHRHAGRAGSGHRGSCRPNRGSCRRGNSAVAKMHTEPSRSARRQTSSTGRQCRLTTSGTTGTTSTVSSGGQPAQRDQRPSRRFIALRRGIARSGTGHQHHPLVRETSEPGRLDQQRSLERIEIISMNDRQGIGSHARRRDIDVDDRGQHHGNERFRAVRRAPDDDRVTPPQRSDEPQCLLCQSTRIVTDHLQLTVGIDTDDGTQRTSRADRGLTLLERRPRPIDTLDAHDASDGVHHRCPSIRSSSHTCPRRQGLRGARRALPGVGSANEVSSPRNRAAGWSGRPGEPRASSRRAARRWSTHRAGATFGAHPTSALTTARHLVDASAQPSPHHVPGAGFEPALHVSGRGV